MGPFQSKYLTCIMAFSFHSIHYVTLCKFYSINFPVSFTKNKKLRNKRKEELKEIKKDKNIFSN